MLDGKHAAAIDAAFAAFLSEHATILRLRWRGRESADHTVRDEDLAALVRLPGLAGPGAAAVRGWVREMRKAAAGEILGPLADTVSDLGKRLGKDVDITLVGADVRVDADKLAPFFRNLIHLVRNAVDHGLEAPAQRGAKPPVDRGVTLTFPPAVLLQVKRHFNIIY